MDEMCTLQVSALEVSRALQGREQAGVTATGSFGSTGGGGGAGGDLELPRDVTGENVHLEVDPGADGELVEIVFSAGDRQPDAAPRAGSLAICLARTLLEMQGTSLLEIETAAGGWRAVTALDRATQTDFFAEDGRRQPRELAAAV